MPDVLTRIPINYLGRIINVELFGFSITFDRVLGAVSTALAAWVFGLYFIRHKLGSIWLFLIMAVTFSLNQWEMLTNGIAEDIKQKGNQNCKKKCQIPAKIPLRSQPFFPFQSGTF